jgi:glutamyl-tRNA reductase
MNNPEMALTSQLPILMIGLNHKVAPVEVRERLAFGPDQVIPALHELVGQRDTSGTVIKEAVLLSTCNRTEVYIHTDDFNRAESELQKFLSQHAGLSVNQLRSMEYILRGDETAMHLMEVSAGLDSLVLGEHEILGQVRSASEMAQSANTCGPILSALFRYAIRVGKRARTETSIGNGNISVACVVVELAEQVFGSLHNRTALLIGAGKISSITARALVKAGLHCVMIANRTYERAKKMAENLNGVAVHFDALGEILVQADIVICSTGAPHFVLHTDTVRKAQQLRNGRTQLIADLAVPRDADPEIASINGVQLVNIDDLETIVKTSHPLTSLVCHAVEEIARQELDFFSQWCAARRCASIIKELHEKAETICQSEVEQTLRRMGSLTPRQEELVQSMGKSIVGKLLYEPTNCLRELSPDEDASSYIEMVQQLFGIE